MSSRKRKIDAVAVTDGVQKKLKLLNTTTVDVGSTSNPGITTQPPPPNPQVNHLDDTHGGGKKDTRVVHSVDDNSLQKQSSQTTTDASNGRRVKKLVPPRPWPVIPPSQNATGPRSAQKEGKNYICLTRKTTLSSYMRRCKSLILNDGYKTIHLSAMGAAIPHLMQLTCALPDILPFSRDEVHVAVQTGTVEVQDEIVPNNSAEDIIYNTRFKSTLTVTFVVGQENQDLEISKNRRRQRMDGRMKGGESTVERRRIILEEPEQDDLINMV
ncbi:hypothetical protein AX17_001925 [Amanita inopinata Kibby_2008]|nr:hypothetical protein AX17_001925 [Amanita inopinata Kibby_2008]